MRSNTRWKTPVVGMDVGNLAMGFNCSRKHLAGLNMGSLCLQKHIMTGERIRTHGHVAQELCVFVA